MNYGELKAAVSEWAHRTDIADQLDLFAANVSEKLDERLGTTTGPLIADSDTNDILEHHGNIYLNGMLAEEAEYTHELSALQAYTGLFDRAVDNLNINYRGDEWDTTPPAMEPYVEAE